MASASTVDPMEEAIGKIPPDAPKAGERWVHYKGDEYEILGVGLKEDTLAPMVAYRSVVHGFVWIRDLAVFMEVIRIEGVVGGLYPYHRFARKGGLS